MTKTYGDSGRLAQDGSRPTDEFFSALMISKRRRFRAEVCSIDELFQALWDQHLLPIKESGRIVGPLLASDPPVEVYYLDPDDVPKLMPEESTLDQWCFANDSGAGYRAECLAAACGNWRAELWHLVGIRWLEARRRFDVRDPVSYRNWKEERIAEQTAAASQAVAAASADPGLELVALRAEIDTHRGARQRGQKWNAALRRELLRQYEQRMRLPGSNGAIAEEKLGELWDKLKPSTIHGQLTIARK